MPLVRAALPDVTDQDNQAGARDLPTIDQAAPVRAAEQERDPFAELGAENEPPSVQPGRVQGSALIVGCAVPAALRQASATTPGIASVPRVMRKDRRPRQQDPQAESAWPLGDLAIPAAAPRGTRPLGGGPAAVPPLAMRGADRMPGAAKKGVAILVPTPPDTKRFTGPDIHCGIEPAFAGGLHQRAKESFEVVEGLGWGGEVGDELIDLEFEVGIHAENLRQEGS